MSKITLTDLATISDSAITAINSNHAAITTALDNFLSRDGTAPNSMAADLDMNSQRILNLPEAVADTEPLRKGEYTPGADATAAAASASAAATSASSAATSATSAASSATTASAARDEVVALGPLLQFSNVAGLRARTGTTNSIRAAVNGQSTQGSGGSEYWYDSSDTTTADDGINTIVDAGGRRWKLITPLQTSLDNLEIGDLASTRIPSNRTLITPVGFSTVDPFSTRWKKISAPGVTKPWHKQSVDGQWWTLSDHIAHPYMFGNVGQNGDDTDAFQDMFEWVTNAQPGPAGYMFVPPGDYQVSNVDLRITTSQGTRTLCLSGYGARLAPYNGGLAGGFLLRALDVPNPVIIEGFEFATDGTHNLANSIELLGSSNIKIRDCYFPAGGAVGEETILIKPDNSPDSSYWTHISNCWFRNNGAHDVAAAIHSHGANNRIKIFNNNITTGTTGAGVLMDAAAGLFGGNSLANQVAITHNSFEGCGYGIDVDIPDADNGPFGLTSYNNGFDTVTYGHRFRTTGTPATNDSPPRLSGNSYIGGTARVTNPAGIVYYDMDTTRTWQTVTGSRSIGTTYTNDTGADIQVNVGARNSAAFTGSCTVYISVDGTPVSYQQVSLSSQAETVYVSASIPPGSTYTAAMTGFDTKDGWYELRE